MATTIRSSLVPLTLLALLPACDKTTDLGDLSGEGQAIATLSCDSDNTITYAHAFAMTGTRYHQLLAEAWGEGAPYNPLRPDEMVLLFSSDAEMSCEALVDPFNSVENRKVVIRLPPEAQGVGTYSTEDPLGTDDADDLIFIDSEVSGPSPGPEPGGGGFGGSLPGSLQVTKIDDNTVEGAVCYDDPEIVAQLGFDPSVAFALTVCPD